MARTTRLELEAVARGLSRAPDASASVPCCGSLSSRWTCSGMTTVEEEFSNAHVPERLRDELHRRRKMITGRPPVRLSEPLSNPKLLPLAELAGYAERS
jgi:hypothetical protein